MASMTSAGNFLDYAYCVGKLFREISWHDSQLTFCNFPLGQCNH